MSELPKGHSLADTTFLFPRKGGAEDEENDCNYLPGCHNVDDIGL